MSVLYILAFQQRVHVMTLFDENSSAVPPVVFHLFPELPAELRDEIWRLCLPERVYELDEPDAKYVSWMDDDAMDGPWPCKLSHTTEMNRRPPLISQVCHESRCVAFKTGKMMPSARGGHWLEQEWHANDVHNAWHDTTRDLVHLNWYSWYEVDCGFSNGSPLHCLAWAAANTARSGSLTFDYLKNLHGSRCVSLTTDYGNNTRKFPPLLHFKPPEDHSVELFPLHKRARYRDLDALNRMSKCLVVMQNVVVHSDVHSAAGLFGLLGDARVQIVDISDAARIEAYLDFAEQCECKDPHAIKQHFRRESNASMEARLNAVLTKQFQDQEIVPTVSPAIMFRLCTQMCNRRKYKQEKREQKRREQEWQRGRGRGRGHGRLRLLG